MYQNGKLSTDNLKIILNLTLPILHANGAVPPKIIHSAAHLFLSFTNHVFPTNLIVFPMVVQFVHVAPTLRYASQQTNHLNNSAICNLLLKPWGDINQDDLNQRNILINVFFDSLTKDFRELSVNLMNESRITETVGNVLPALSHIVEYCKNFPMASKRLLCNSIKSCFDHALILFPGYVKYNQISNHFLNFFLNVLGVLQQHLGVESTKVAVEVFLQVAVSEQQVSNLSGLDKLLQILQLVVEAPGNSYKTFLPSILQLCMENVYPLIVNQASECPDVFLALLTLLHR